MAQDAAETASALQELLDRAAITRVVQDWGLARDTGRWDELRAFYTPDAIMQTTWFVGPAAEFVDRSIAAAQKGARGQHFIGTATIALRGHKAVVETRMMLLLRAKVGDLEVDATCWGRFHDRFVKSDGQWRIQWRVPVYEKDRLDLVDPSATLVLDPELLERQQEGCRHLTYLQSLAGMSITPDVPVPGSASLQRLEAESAQWLAADTTEGGQAGR